MLVYRCLQERDLYNRNLFVYSSPGCGVRREGKAYIQNVHEFGNVLLSSIQKRPLLLSREGLGSLEHCLGSAVLDLPAASGYLLDKSCVDAFAGEVDFGGLVGQDGHVNHSALLRPVLSNVELDHRRDGCDRVGLGSELYQDNS